MNFRSAIHPRTIITAAFFDPVDEYGTNEWVLITVASLMWAMFIFLSIGLAHFAVEGTALRDGRPPIPFITEVVTKLVFAPIVGVFGKQLLSVKREQSTSNSRGEPA